MKITIDHPESKAGVPIILDGNGNTLSYPLGVKAIRAKFDLTQCKLGQICCVSKRTVIAWESGQLNPSAEALNLMARLLKDPPVSLKMELHIGRKKRVIQYLESGSVIVFDPFFCEPCKAEIVIQLGGREFTWPVRLPHGMLNTCAQVEIVHLLSV